jgi:hypothetical protein
MTTESYRLDPLYVNGRRVTALVGASSVSRHLGKQDAFSERHYKYIICIRLAEFLAEWLLKAGNDVAPFEQDWAMGRVVSGRTFTVCRHFVFRNAQGRRKNVKPLAYTTFPELGDSGGELRLELQIHPSHVVDGSPGDLLSGKVGDVFVCAKVIEVAPNRVAAVPVFIGHQVLQGPIDLVVHTGHDEVHPNQIDNFSAIRGLPHPATTELDALRAVSEHQVKMAFAEILGEPDVPKDWGGEHSDLVTTQVQQEGRRTSAAFLFKGPAGGEKFRPMEVRDLGKHGDQIVRLATEPVELLVVQHCHKVKVAVRSMLRAFANQIGHERKYCVIDGYDTLKILRAYGKCNL